MMAVPSPEGLLVEGLACRRGERLLFRDLSFSVLPGAALFVRGANGVGKSSLLRVLSGLLPFEGTVSLNGLTAEDDAGLYHRQLAWLGHLDGLQPNETAREAVDLRARLWGQGSVEPAMAAMNVKDFANREARYLSAGQKRRAALAGVIATGAPLWLLDEPTTGLDAASIDLFRVALQWHLDRGGMAVIVTHDAEWGDGQMLSLSANNNLVIPGEHSETRDPSPTVSVTEMTRDGSRITPCGLVRDDSYKRKFLFLPILHRDLRLSLRQGGQLLTAILFFILVVMLLAFGVGPDPQLLQSIAPGAVWVAALLSSLVSLERLFGADHEAGALDMLQASPVSGEALALAKMLAHWLTNGLPLTIASLAAGLLLHLLLRADLAMLAALALGTPVLSLLGGAIAALLLGARRGSLILTLLLLPLYIPTLIFGAAAIQKALANGSSAGPLGFLAALLALALPLAPIAAAAALEE
jgi:heme exporter protein B